MFGSFNRATNTVGIIYYIFGKQVMVQGATRSSESDMLYLLGQYKHWRNKTTTLLRASKKNFFYQSIAENKDNTFLWRPIKRLNGHNEGMKIPDEINIDGNTFKQKHGVIEQLHYLFSSINKRLKSDDSQTNDINEYEFTNLKDYEDSKVPNEINFKIPFMTGNPALILLPVDRSKVLNT